MFSVDSLSLPRLQKANITGVLGTFNTLFWSPDLDVPQNKKFVADYKQRYNAPPSYNAEGAYVAVYAYKAAIEKAGKVDGDAIAAALKGLEITAPTGDKTIRINRAVMHVKADKVVVFLDV